MIHIEDKSDCCGCNACTQVCPKQCIDMTEDKEGFLYPHVDMLKCIDCGLCEKVCPVINQGDARKPLNVYAAKNKDEQIRLDSSSGGLFTLIAESVINDGGVVFGAKFNENWEVVHDFSETIEGLVPFRKSKYVQSTIGDSYKKVRSFLKEGRKVLFTGVPCQVAGLKLFLRKEYENLFTVDVVCHGVPSPLVWRKYLKESLLTLKVDKYNTSIKITDINFRNKDNGWKSYHFTLTGLSGEKQIKLDEPFNKNIFMRGFLQNLYLRPSCYKCPSKSFKSGSDITLGDFWGINKRYPKLDDDKGISIVSINSAKSNELLELVSDKISLKKVLLQDALRANPCVEQSVSLNKNRASFFEHMTDMTLIHLNKRYCRRIGVVKKIIRKLFRILKNMR